MRRDRHFRVKDETDAAFIVVDPPPSLGKRIWCALGIMLLVLLFSIFPAIITYEGIAAIATGRMEGSSKYGSPTMYYGAEARGWGSMYVGLGTFCWGMMLGYLTRRSCFHWIGGFVAGAMIVAGAWILIRHATQAAG